MIIRLLNNQDYERVAQYHLENYLHFKPWSPAQTADFHSTQAWFTRIQDYTAQQRQKTAAYFVAYSPEHDKILAHCTLSQVIHGAFQACYMGFGVSKCSEGRGIMHKTCSTAIAYAFEELQLNRIMANYMPHNNRSANRLKKLGFQREGLAKNYLKIAGKWENHVLMSLIKP